MMKPLYFLERYTLNLISSSSIFQANTAFNELFSEFQTFSTILLAMFHS